MARLRLSNERERVASQILLGALLALQIPSSPAPAGPTPQIAPGPAAGPGPAGLEVPWSGTWDEAVEAARKIPNGRILVYFADEDCGACQRMEALVIPSTSFFAFMRDKAALRVTLRSPEGQKLATRLRVRDAPSWVVVTPDLLVTGRQSGSTTQMGWVQAFVEAERQWASYRKRLDAEKADPSDLRVVFDVARESFQRGGDSVAEPRFARLAGDSRTPSDLREQSLAYLATIQLDSGRPEEAAASLDRLLEIAADPALRQKAQLRRAEVEIARGRKDLAVGRLRAFRKEWPGSPLLPEVDKLLEALKPGASDETRSP